MAVPIESPNLPGGPPPDSDQLESLERIEQLENIVRSLIGSLNKYSYVSNEYAETMLGTLDDIPDGDSYGRVLLAGLESGLITTTGIAASTILVGDLDATTAARIFSSEGDKTMVEGWEAGTSTLIDGGDIYAGSSITVGSNLVNGSITITNTPAGHGDSKIQCGKTDFGQSTNGFIIGVDDSDSDKVKMEFGNDSYYLKWDGSSLLVKSDSVVIGDAIPATVYNFASVGLETSTINDFICYSDSTGVAGVRFIKSHQDTVGYTETIDEEDLGTILFCGVPTGETEFQVGARINVTQDGNATANFLPARLEIITTNGTSVYTNTFTPDGYYIPSVGYKSSDGSAGVTDTYDGLAFKNGLCTTSGTATNYANTVCASGYYTSDTGDGNDEAVTIDVGIDIRFLRIYSTMAGEPKVSLVQLSNGTYANFYDDATTEGAVSGMTLTNNHTFSATANISGVNNNGNHYYWFAVGVPT